MGSTHLTQDNLAKVDCLTTLISSSILVLLCPVKQCIHRLYGLGCRHLQGASILPTTTGEDNHNMVINNQRRGAHPFKGRCKCKSKATVEHEILKFIRGDGVRKAGQHWLSTNINCSGGGLIGWRR